MAQAETVSPPVAEAKVETIALRRAVDLLAKKDIKAAVFLLERLVSDDEGWAIARAYLGIAYLRATRVADAREQLEKAVAQAPDSFVCRSKYAEFLARLGFYDQAMVQLDHALANSPPDNDSRFAAMELRQFCKDKSKGIFYRNAAYPNLSPRRLLRALTPRRQAGIALPGGN